MVERGAFFTDGTNVLFKKVKINWDKGFDKQAKACYIKDIQKALPPDLLPSIDVTSASTDKIGKSLSPIFLETPDGNTVEDYYKDYGIPGVIDYLYISCLGKAQRRCIAQHASFIDVFHKPENGRGSQACICAFYRLLLIQNRLDVLKDDQEFLEWYNNVSFYII